MNIGTGLHVDPREIADMATRLARESGATPLKEPEGAVPDPVTWLASRNPAIAEMFRTSPEFARLVMQQAIHLAMQAKEQGIPFADVRLGRLQRRGRAGAYYDFNRADGQRILARDTRRG